MITKDSDDYKRMVEEYNKDFMIMDMVNYFEWAKLPPPPPPDLSFLHNFIYDQGRSDSGGFYYEPYKFLL